MTDDRMVTLDGWKTAVLDEVLFRAAAALSAGAAPRTDGAIETVVTFVVSTADDGRLVVGLESTVDGTVTTSLSPPF